MKNSTHKEPRGLSFSDYLMFKLVMEREDICRGVIERILGIPIGRIEYHNTEQEIRGLAGGKTIRLDSYLVESCGRLFDVEMQVGACPAFPKRLRGYQSIMDAGTLKRGEDYDRLKESYLLFICLDDPFGEGLPVYTIERTCKEAPHVAVGCAAHWVVLNASAYGRVEGNDGLRSLLKYVATDEVPVGDAFLAEVDDEVARNNRDKAVIGMMIDTMTMLKQEARVQGRAEGRAEGHAEGHAEGRAEGLEEGRAEGLEKGKAAGMDQYGALVAALLDAGRVEDVRRASADAAFRDRLFAEFGMA